MLCDGQEIHKWLCECVRHSIMKKVLDHSFPFYLSKRNENAICTCTQISETYILLFVMLLNDYNNIC